MADEMPDVIAAPRDALEREAWRQELRAWRERARAGLGYDGAAYRRREFDWVSRCYSCSMAMLWDESFVDARRGEYRVEEYLREGERAFGGYDAVVLWHAYPRIGFDDRNQFDFYREAPGGLPGLRDAVRRFHRHGVRVFVDYNPWDTGTRREPGSDAEVLASLVRGIEADGVFLDTLSEGGMALRTAMDRARTGVAMESELALPLRGIPLNHLSWAQWFEPGSPVGVLRNRWFEPRHMMHLVRRWDTDHTGELHLAWMNGAGMLVWENVFGSWNGWSLRNRAILRSMLAVQGQFHRHFSDGVWTPLIETSGADVAASEWSRHGVRLWTVVNQGPGKARGPHFDPRLEPGHRLFDLLEGREIGRPDTEMAPGGIGAYLSCSQVTEELRSFLAAQAHREGLGVETTSRRRRIVQVAPPVVAFTISPFGAESVARIPEGEYEVVSRYRSRECGERGYAHLQSLAYPPLHGEVTEVRRVRLPELKIDVQEVSNEEFHRFLLETKYRPARMESFLRHWVDGKPVAGTDQEPVTYVDLDDARAYAKWAGKRLPTDAEWQVAAEREVLIFREPRVWNWTESEATDGHTRFCLLKGGSWYDAKGSAWYADGGPRAADFTAKFIRMHPALDRCATIGFRCVEPIEP